MAFSFPLETVLHLRQRREEAEERELAALRHQRQQVMAALTRVQQAKRQWSVENQREIGGVAPAVDRQIRYARLKSLQDTEANLKLQLQELAERSREKQATYLVARSARETLTELKQQQRTSFEAAREYREQRLVEDLILNKLRRAGKAETKLK